VLRVFFQEISEYRPRRRAVFFEEALFFFLDPVCPLAPCPQGTVESEMAQEVERIGFRLVARHPQLVEVDAALLQL
jgi:hypothetical protein